MFGLGQVHAPRAWLSAAEAAEWLGVSGRRVRALLAEGALEGRPGADGAWQVSRMSVVARAEQEPRPVRPLAMRGARLLADAIALGLGEEPSAAWGDASSRDRGRASAHLERLGVESDPVRLVRAWTRHRRVTQGRRRVSVPAEVPLIDLAGVRLSGVSHPLSRLEPAGEIEIHVTGGEGVRAVERATCAPRAAAALDVWVHCSDDWSVGDVVFDLVEHDGARESADASRLLRVASLGRSVGVDAESTTR